MTNDHHHDSDDNLNDHQHNPDGDCDHVTPMVIMITLMVIMTLLMVIIIIFMMIPISLVPPSQVPPSLLLCHYTEHCFSLCRLKPDLDH